MSATLDFTHYFKPRVRGGAKGDDMTGALDDILGDIGIDVGFVDRDMLVKYHTNDLAKGGAKTPKVKFSVDKSTIKDVIPTLSASMPLADLKKVAKITKTTIGKETDKTLLIDRIKDDYQRIEKLRASVKDVPENITRSKLSSMPKPALQRLARENNVKGARKLQHEQLIDALVEKATKKTTISREGESTGTTEDVLLEGLDLLSLGASEAVGHELFDSEKWTPQQKAKWKDNPNDIAPEDRPIHISFDEAFEPNPRDTTPEGYNEGGKPFSMNSTYFLPKFDDNDPRMRKLTELMNELRKYIKKSTSRKGTAGVGQTQPLMFFPRDTGKGEDNPWRKDIHTQSSYREANLSGTTKQLLKESTGKGKELIRLLVDIGRDVNPLPFSTIQINVDYEAVKHIDKGNSGLSMIFSAGDYTGGELCINGLDLNIKHHPLLFNGKENLHEVKPITNKVMKGKENVGGHRYSFVYYLAEPRGADIFKQQGRRIGIPIINYKTYVMNTTEYQQPLTMFKTEELDFDIKKESQLDIASDRTKKPLEQGVEINIEPSNTSVQPRKIELNETIDDTGFYTPMGSPESEVFYTPRSMTPFELNGEGKRGIAQERYSQICRHLEGAGMLHLMGKGDTKATSVPANKVFSTKYQQDNIYVLPKISKSDPLIRQLEEYMNTHEIPINKSRANSGVGRSQTIGAVRQKFKTTYNDSAYTKANPELKKLLFAIGKKYNPLPFTSVQVNQNYECKPHIDKNNIGLSMIFALGDYEGGHLYINDEKHDIKAHPLIFNGAKNLHYVSKITSGDRYSFVFFRTGDKALREKVKKVEGGCACDK